MAEAAAIAAADLLVWLRRYIGRHPFPITPRLRESRRWLAELEGEPSEESGEGGR